MDRELIKSLIDALATSDLSELEYTAEGMTLRLVKGAVGYAVSAAPRPGAPPRPQPAASPVSADQLPTKDHSTVITAPLYGVVHLQRTPGLPAMVAVGDAVEPGETLCLIEAMKVFTELRAEHAGTIAAVLVESGEEVEAGQPLFRMSA